MTPQERLQKIQRFITRMPSLSTTVAKVLEICNDPQSSPNDLNKVISLDPVLTGQVLKLINSAYYGLPDRITSLTRAIIMLGLNTVKNLVLATSILSNFKGNRAIRGTLTDTFWEHSLGVGATARVLAKFFKVPALEQEEFFVTGLLHDLGKLPIMASFPPLYQLIIKLHEEQDLQLFEIEKKLLGFDHCHVNRLIFAKWKLSEDMLNAAVFHHRPFNPEADQNKLLMSISLANVTVHRFQQQPPEMQQEKDILLTSLTKACNIEYDQVMALKDDIEEQIEKARVFLNVAGKG
jgi:HD-like signal output (HDOD) protein